MSSNNSLNDIKCLEHQTLKVPYEVLNKKFRLAQKSIDREVQKVQAALKDLEKCMNPSNNNINNSSSSSSSSSSSNGLENKVEDQQDITQALIGVTEKLLQMKRKAEESIHEEIEAAKACKRRLNHLKEKENGDGSLIVVSPWTKKRLDRMLVEYFLRSGYYDSAVQLAGRSEIEDLTNLDLFLVSREVETALMQKDTSKCLLWCQDNKSKLRKIKSVLEFSLRQQEFIELLKAGRTMEAIKHAKKHFSTLEDPQYEQIQKCMGLLAFPMDTQLSSYKDLLDPKRWQKLVELFRRENYKLYQLNSESIFTVTLQAGLSALKTPRCYVERAEPDQQDCIADVNSEELSGVTKRSKDCPVCKPPYNSLAKRLQFAHCSQSKLICALSGQPMNEHNPPTMMPNGHVYGYQSLLEMAEKNNGKVTCPRTKEVFFLRNCDKVYVM